MRSIRRCPIVRWSSVPRSSAGGSAVLRPSLFLVALVLVIMMTVGGSQAATGATGASAATPAVDELSAPDLLFESTIPAGSLPSNPVWIDVYRMAWDPGAT